MRRVCVPCVLLSLFIICNSAQDKPKGYPDYHVDIDVYIDYVGVLSTGCVNKYVPLYLTRHIPPRTYQYYHEVVSPAAIEARTQDVDVGWRIVGGRLASIEEVPYQVLYGRYCGGALIAPDWVITAAHCKQLDKFVYAGSTQRSQADPYKICAHFIHPMWNTSRHHSHDFDYQLILLERSVPVGPGARPIAIGRVEDVMPGVMISISGWGHLEYKKSKMQEFLRRAYVPIMSTALCKTMPDGNYDKITPRMFCAGYVNGSRDSCQGDSGGPAVINGMLVGMVSYGVGCGGSHHPGVYSLVPMARDWIRSITGLPL